MDGTSCTLSSTTCPRPKDDFGTLHIRTFEVLEPYISVLFHRSLTAEESWETESKNFTDNPLKTVGCQGFCAAPFLNERMTDWLNEWIQRSSLSYLKGKIWRKKFYLTMENVIKWLLHPIYALIVTYNIYYEVWTEAVFSNWFYLF